MLQEWISLNMSRMLGLTTSLVMATGVVFAGTGSVAESDSVSLTSERGRGELAENDQLLTELCALSDLVRHNSAAGERRATELYTSANERSAGNAAAVALIQRACARAQLNGLQAGVEDYKLAYSLISAEVPPAEWALFLQGVCRFERFSGQERYLSCVLALRRLLDRSSDLPDHVRQCGVLELAVANPRFTEHLSDADLQELATLANPDEQLTAFLRVRELEHLRYAGKLTDPDVVEATFEELSRMSETLRLSELQIHRALLCADLAAELARPDVEQKELAKALEAAMVFESKTDLARCLIRKANSNPKPETGSPEATSFKLALTDTITAINDRDVLRHAGELFKGPADPETMALVSLCVERIAGLNSIVSTFSSEFRLQHGQHLEKIIDTQAEEIESKKAAADRASHRTLLISQAALIVVCILSLILLRDRWSLRKMNQRLQEEISENERQRSEKEKIELRLAQIERLESLGAIAGGIAHDFNNLLVGVIGNADLLRQEATLSEAGYLYVDGILRSAETAADLSHKMLAYAGRQPSTKHVLELNTVLERMVQLFRAGMGKRHTIQFTPSEEVLFTKADPSQVEQIAMNLVTNALQAMGERNGIIQISTGSCMFDKIPVDMMTIGSRKEGGRFVWFEITDNGPGIPVHQQSRIFEPFYSTKRQSTGHGFGLSVVYGHVNRNNGLIQLFSIEGHGTTFRVLLPWHQTSEPALPKPGPIDRPARITGNCNIVVVDDQQEVIDVLQRTLSVAGLRPSSFVSSTEALEFLMEHREVGCLLLDILMPESTASRCSMKCNSKASGFLSS